MPIKKTWFVRLVLVFVTIYTLLPFINGVGCDFEHEFESKTYKLEAECKLGILIHQSQDKISGEIKLKRMMWGFWGGYNYTLSLDSVVLKNPDVLNKRQSALYDVHRLIVGYRYNVLDGIVWIYDKPVEVIYATEGNGVFGFW
ncbi:TPA: hypothetical protein PMD70_003658 [Vibrio cholerae]|nr:hypothetical protein [Vibrio cholerae]